MNDNSTSPTLINLNFNQLFLEIPPVTEDLPNWSFSTIGAHRRAYLNQLCLHGFLPWLREEHGTTAHVWIRYDLLPSFWEFVNGTAIVVDHSIRIVIIPTESIDLKELRVPQEWVDIPHWTADYYLQIQVNPEDDYICIVGYTTHHRLKTMGIYDPGDRTYCLNGEDLIKNVNLLWLARQFCPEEPVRTDVISLPILSLSQAENLCARLGNPDLVFPRLEIPFPLWGSLMEHGGWRQRLYEKRQGMSEQWSVEQWLQTGISQIAQQFGWERGILQPLPVMAGMRGIEGGIEVSAITREIAIAGNLYHLHIFAQGNPSDRIWRFELRNRLHGGLIPAGWRLKLLSEDLQPFENNIHEAETAIERLYLEVMVEPGEGLVWEIEPTPEEYEREILRF